MNFTKTLILSLLVLFFMAGCGDGENSDDSGNADIENAEGDGGEGEAEADGPTAASIWDGHSLRAEPDGKSKWLASVSFGEKLLLQDESKSDDKYTYEKVELLDGKEGWVRDDLIHKGGKLGVVTKSAQVYARPSISNITDKTIDFGTLVVVKQEKEEFQEFIAKNDKANNRQRGWLLGASTVTTNETDIAVAVLLDKAKSESNRTKRKAMLETISANDSYKSSVFYDMAIEMYDGMGEAAAELGPDELMITGNNVNVRSLPATEGSEILFQLFDGDVVKIVKKGEMAEIGGNLDYWYEVMTMDGQKGWVYGKFTSKAL